MREPALTWDLAHAFALHDADAWDRVLEEHERLDPLTTLPVHSRLVEQLLGDAGAQNSRRAAKRRRTIAPGFDRAHLP